MLSAEKINLILTFLDCDINFLNELISIYSVEMANGLKKLKENTDNQKIIKSTCHKLRGTAKLLMLNKLTENLTEAENLAREQKCTKSIINKVIFSIQIEIEHLEKYLKSC